MTADFTISQSKFWLKLVNQNGWNWFTLVDKLFVHGHSVWKSPKSRIQLCERSELRLQTWSLRSSNVTRQSKIDRKGQNWKFQMRHFEWFSNIVYGLVKVKGALDILRYSPNVVTVEKLLSFVLSFFLKGTYTNRHLLAVFAKKGSERDSKLLKFP